jgi:uncharacterized repeat protein (TIGR03803 family)
MHRKISAVLTPALVACGITAVAVATPAAAEGFSVLHSGCRLAGCPDGTTSVGGVILQSDGALIGTGGGGKNGRGVLFRLAAGAHGADTGYTRLHNFCSGTCKDGGNPDFPLIRDANGNVYGTTTGGAGGGGTIFEASAAGKVKALHAFCSDDCGTGFSPSSGVTYQGAAFGLTYDGTAPLYGTTSKGGLLSGGTVYSVLRRDGKTRVKALYSFCSSLPCEDGAAPLGGLTVDDSNHIFGVANLGGAHEEGAVFELSPEGRGYAYRLIYSFCSEQSCTDGIHPSAGLVIDSAGNLYGTTQRSGDHDEGTVFELSPKGGGYSFQVLYQFVGQADGGAPEAAMTIDSGGNLFGTATQGGDAGTGVVFELSPSDIGWTESVLYSFCAKAGCADGSVPFSPLTMDATGDLFGSTAAGGANNAGVVFEIAR